MTTVSVVTVVQEHGQCTIALTGDIDLASVDQVNNLARAAVQAPGLTSVVIDLADVQFMDSTGIGALVGIRNAAVDVGLAVRLVQPPARVRDLLAMTGLDQVFDVDPGQPSGELSA